MWWYIYIYICVYNYKCTTQGKVNLSQPLLSLIIFGVTSFRSLGESWTLRPWRGHSLSRDQQSAGELCDEGAHRPVFSICWGFAGFLFLKWFCEVWSLFLGWMSNELLDALGSGDRGFGREDTGSTRIRNETRHYKSKYCTAVLHHMTNQPPRKRRDWAITWPNAHGVVPNQILFVVWWKPARVCVCIYDACWIVVKDVKRKYSLFNIVYAHVQNLLK